jgi:hypothetical protein
MAAVSNSEQLPEEGLVRMTHVTTESDFNGILRRRRVCELFWVALETGMSEREIHQCNKMLKNIII